MTAHRNGLVGAGAVVRKPPKNEPAGREAQVLTGGYGDLLAMKWPPGELEWALS